MKLVKKLSIFALAALLAFGSACHGVTTPGGSNSAQGDVAKYYGNPAEDFVKYDNRLYNEYLMGEETTIANQWLGYGIGDPFMMRWNGAYDLYALTPVSESRVEQYK